MTIIGDIVHLDMVPLSGAFVRDIDDELWFYLLKP